MGVRGEQAAPGGAETAAGRATAARTTGAGTAAAGTTGAGTTSALPERGTRYRSGPAILVRRGSGFVLLAPGTRAELIEAAWSALSRIPVGPEFLSELQEEAGSASAAPLRAVVFGALSAERCLLGVRGDVPLRVTTAREHLRFCAGPEGLTVREFPGALRVAVGASIGGAGERGLRIESGIVGVRGFLHLTHDAGDLPPTALAHLRATEELPTAPAATAAATIALAATGFTVPAHAATGFTVPAPAAGALGDTARKVLPRPSAARPVATHPPAVVPRTAPAGDPAAGPGSAGLETAGGETAGDETAERIAAGPGTRRASAVPAVPRPAGTPPSTPPPARPLTFEELFAGGPHREAPGDDDSSDGSTPPVPPMVPPVREVEEAPGEPAPEEPYGHLFGTTVPRRVEDAAIRPSEPSAGDTPPSEPSAGDTPPCELTALTGPRPSPTASERPDARLRANAVDAPRDPLLARAPRPVTVIDRVPGEDDPPRGALELPTGKRIELEGMILVGRRPRAQAVRTSSASGAPRLVALPSPRRDISRCHLAVRGEGRTVLAEDLGSTNGTRLHRRGGAAVALLAHHPVTLCDGDVLEIGEGIRLCWRDHP